MKPSLYPYLIIFLLILPQLAYAEDLSLESNANGFYGSDLYPISLYAEITPNPVKAGQKVTLAVFGRTAPGQHIYATTTQGEFSPEPTRLVFKVNPLQAASSVSESATELIYDEAFEETLEVHKDDFWLKQDFTVDPHMKTGNHIIIGSMVYQVCDNKTCSLLQRKQFRVVLTVKK